MHMNLLTVLLQGAPTGFGGVQIFIMVGMVVVMYFFMIRPQAKRAKEQKKFAESIAANEKVITTAGIHGTINRVNDDGTLQLEIGRGMFITIERSAVSMELTAAARKKAETGATGVVATAK